VHFLYLIEKTFNYFSFHYKFIEGDIMENFADRLLNAIDEKQNPSVVGLDPRIADIPSHIKEENVKKFGNTVEAVSASFLEFNKLIIDAVADIVPAVKPQMAFYEKYLTPGIQAFIGTVNYAKEKGLIVIEDAKRNDIGPKKDSTAGAYSDGHIGRIELCDGQEIPGFDVDAITVNAYLGSDCPAPFIEDCKKYGKGIFVLVKTSNDSSGEIQDIEIGVIGAAEELGYVRTVYTDMACLVNKWGQGVIGNRGYSSVGAVVGATYPKDAVVARRIMPKAMILVPGYGHQGGMGKDTLPNFNKDGYGAIVNNARGIIFAYKKEPFKNTHGPREFDKAAREAAIMMKEDITKALYDAGILAWSKS